VEFKEKDREDDAEEEFEVEWETEWVGVGEGKGLERTEWGMKVRLPEDDGGIIGVEGELAEGGKKVDDTMAGNDGVKLN
jgi:hypothetical protein